MSFGSGVLGSECERESDRTTESACVRERGLYLRAQQRARASASVAAVLGVCFVFFCKRR